MPAAGPRHTVEMHKRSGAAMNTAQQLPFSHIRVRDAMHQGIISVSPDTNLRELARLMAQRRVHAIAISSGGGRPLGIVSALDVVAALASGADRSAGQFAATELVTVSARERLDRAAQLMAEHDLSHLVVTDAGSGYPSGVLSTLDVIAAYGG
jgi:CBS domain-containing protein